MFIYILFCFILSCLLMHLTPFCHAAQSTNPFVAPGVAPAAAPSNPFQSNGRAAHSAAAAAAAAAGQFGDVWRCKLSVLETVVASRT